MKLLVLISTPESVLPEDGVCCLESVLYSLPPSTGGHWEKMLCEEYWGGGLANIFCKNVSAIASLDIFHTKDHRVNSIVITHPFLWLLFQNGKVIGVMHNAWGQGMALLSKSKMGLCEKRTAVRKNELT